MNITLCSERHVPSTAKTLTYLWSFRWRMFQSRVCYFFFFFIDISIVFSEIEQILGGNKKVRDKERWIWSKVVLYGSGLISQLYYQLPKTEHHCNVVSLLITVCHLLQNFSLSILCTVETNLRGLLFVTKECEHVISFEN